jgi:hypothetical protein
MAACRSGFISVCHWANVMRSDITSSIYRPAPTVLSRNLQQWLVLLIPVQVTAKTRRREGGKHGNACHFSKLGNLHLAGECKTAPELAVSQRVLRVFAPLLFTSNGGVSLRDKRAEQNSPARWEQVDAAHGG